jgi:2-C-methyl-D-erythritol 2,4-cyclodiphosphate synthase
MMRIGQGYDVHEIDATRPLVLGGVAIPDHAGLAGHSDADVILHAIADALLGAAGLGDLGLLFPASDEWRGESSLRILEEVGRALRHAGWEISNVDSTLIAESPKLAPYRDAMVDRISEALAVDRSRVSIKATTSDGLGFTGRGQGMAAVAVALVTSA